MNILDALTGHKLFGTLPAFRDPAPWSRWLVFLKAIYGFEMTEEDLGTFHRFTGRTVPRAGGYPEAVAIVGRQSGKSSIAGAVCAYEAATTRNRGAFALLIAQDARSATRTLFGYAREPFREVPLFTRELVRETGDTLELKAGVSLAVYPCRPAAIRGVRAVVAALDELAFMRSGEGLPMDREMLRAIRPTLATTGGRLLILSSPYGQSGALWDLHRTHYAQEDSSTLVWQASAPEMNPTLSPDYLVRMERDDPEAYQSEVLGQFRAGVSTLFDPEALERCIMVHRRELPPMAETTYQAFVDPSGGRADAFALAIGHRADAIAVVDCLRAWRPPFNPSGVIEEAAELLRQYRVTNVTGDKYGGEWPREAFRSHAISYTVADLTKSDLYLALLPAINAGRVELLDIPELLRELRGLERRRGSSGRDRVDHPSSGGAHDDRANVVAGLVRLLIGQESIPWEVWGGNSGIRPQTEQEQETDFEARREEAKRVVEDAIKLKGCYWPGD